MEPKLSTSSPTIANENVGGSLIASTNNLKYGDVFVGFKNRDEEFVNRHGRYKMEGDTVEDLDAFIPPNCVITSYANYDVKDFDNKFRFGR